MVESTTAPNNGPQGTHASDAPRRGIRHRLTSGLQRLVARFQTRILIALFFIVLAMIALAPQIFITIPAGHVGVMWYRFLGGTVVDRTYGEGIQMIFPWDEMYVYDARLQNQARVYDTISSNGLSMEVDIAVRYRINREAAGMLHKLVGPDYAEVLVYPEIGSHARELISRYTPEQLYTETRAFIQAEILERMVNQLGSSLVNQSFQGRLVTVEDVLIRSVTLPPRVADAIERKAEQYQAMLEYDFRIAREQKEKERKRIEAEGIREFQDIVAKTITEEYLRLRGIEATMSLATSKNSKTIIIGGKDGLPVILNTADSPVAQTGAETTDDSADTLPSATDFNARSQELPPQNAISPGVKVNPDTSGKAAESDKTAKSQVNAAQPETANPASSDASQPGTMTKLLQAVSPNYDQTAGNATRADTLSSQHEAAASAEPKSNQRQ
ncbi:MULTISPECIES: SPFH domain-containing protein [Thalassospira]|uniref:SPFH domain-containing protein n=1 Tax=Thalassospira aquimaris TaxID=3037796 RepID=A0ABT6GFP4_9PROT|nr:MULTISPECIES: SPFH domain-containing protein [Thalassospira]MDG4720905.1 SPFH domain-containing protein [Thalassospira sp. FZY0004]